MNTFATHLIAPKQNSVIAISDGVGNPVVRRGYGVYGETDPAQMTNAGPGATPLPALRAFFGSKRSPGPFCGLRPPPAKPFGYTGRRWDPDLGLYYYRARWYDPSLGTFLQTDPIGSLDYINLYAYVGLEPGNGVDPSGMHRVLNSKGWELGHWNDAQVQQSRNESVQAVTIVGAAAACAAGPCEAAVVYAATIPKRVVITFIMRGLSAYAKTKDPLPPPTSPPTAILPDRTPLRDPGTPRSSPRPPPPPPLPR
jgi:RHS repeat-associated protein